LLHMALGPEAVQGSAGGPPHDRVIGSVEPARGGVAAPETHSASRPAQSTGTGYHHAWASLLWERPWPRSAGTIAAMAAPTGLLPTSGLPARGTGRYCAGCGSNSRSW